MRALVTGASGFIGRALVPRLARDGHFVRGLVRRAEAAAAGAENVVGDLLDRPSLDRACEGMEAVVHLACATGVARESRVRAVNVEGTRALLEAARRAGVRRFVFVSSVSAVRRRMGPYGRTKREGEKLVAASELEWVVLRPSLVYGAGELGLFARLAHSIRSLPVVPVIGDGRIALDPLDVADLCEVIAQCLERGDVVGKSYDLLGPERLTFDELLRSLAASVGVRPRLLHVPGVVALPIARLLGLLSERPPLSEDNVLGMISEAQVDGAAARRDFPISWTPFAAGLERWKRVA
jgi:nucleoside-diphosphate-sugar epimerase